jgi:hypothetical protein
MRRLVALTLGAQRNAMQCFKRLGKKGCMPVRFVVALVASIGALGCGGSSPSAPTALEPPPARLPIVASGQNWSFRLDGFIGAPERTISPGGLIIFPTYGSRAPLVALEGAFNATAGSVSAVLQPFGRCFDWDVNRVRFSGTRSGNTIELESQPDQGQVVRINVTLLASGDAAQGTYTITGGCGAGSRGPIDGRQVNLTGVWTGMMGEIPARLDMLMADAPDPDGNFGVSGTATFSGTSCFANAVITRRGRGRIVFPDIDGPPHHMELIGEVWEDLTAMKVTFGLTQGTCPELAGGGATFVRQ